MTSRVFVVSEPRKFDPAQGAFVRSVNLNPARKFGELIFLLPPNNEGSSDPTITIETLTEKLKDFSANDYLLPVGNPLYIAWAAAIATDYADGRLNLLHWQPAERCYAIVRSQVFPSQHEAAAE